MLLWTDLDLQTLLVETGFGEISFSRFGMTLRQSGKLRGSILEGVHTDHVTVVYALPALKAWLMRVEDSTIHVTDVRQ